MARANFGGTRKQKASVFGGRYSAASNPTPSGIEQGTPGGTTRGPIMKPSGKRPGMRFRIGDEGYVWFLTLAEVFLMGLLRRWSRGHHGG